MSLQVSHYNMLRASHEGRQKVVVRTVITVRFVGGGEVKGFQGSYLIW
ncbi:hypothetical protein AB7W52_22185, partial [Providencia rettgeri]